MDKLELILKAAAVLTVYKTKNRPEVELFFEIS